MDTLYDYKVELTGVRSRSQMNVDNNTVLLHFVLLIFRLHKVTIKAQPTPNRPLHILALLFLCFIHFTLHDH